MAKKKVRWSFTAELELYDILQYWIDRNKSSRYSESLHLSIEKTTAYIATHPNSGRSSTFLNFRSILIGEYLLFFEETEDEILVISIWHGRQDPERLKKRLE